MAKITKMADIVPQRGAEATIVAMATNQEAAVRVDNAEDHEILVSTEGFGYKQPAGTSNPIPIKTRFEALNNGVKKTTPTGTDLFALEEASGTQKAITFSNLAGAIVATQSGETGSIRWMLEQDESDPPDYTWGLQESYLAFEHVTGTADTPIYSDFAPDAPANEYQYTIGGTLFDSRQFTKAFIRELAGPPISGKMSYGIQLDNMATFIEHIVGDMDLTFDGKIPFALDKTPLYFGEHIAGGVTWESNLLTVTNNPPTEVLRTDSFVARYSETKLHAAADFLTLFSPINFYQFPRTGGTSDPILTAGLDWAQIKQYVEWKIEDTQLDFDIIDGGSW